MISSVLLVDFKQKNNYKLDRIFKDVCYKTNEASKGKIRRLNLSVFCYEDICDAISRIKNYNIPGAKIATLIKQRPM